MLAVDRFFKSEFVRHSALAFAGTFGAQLFNFVFHFYNSRALGVARYGDLFSLINVLLIMQSIFAQIITYVIVKYAAEFHATGDRDRLGALCRRSIAWTSLGALVAIVFSITCKDAVANFLQLADSRSVPALGCIVGIWLMHPSVRGILQGAQDFRRYGTALILEGVLLAALGCGLVAMGFGVTGALSGWALAAACSFVYAYFAARGHFGTNRAILKLDLRRLVQTSSGVALTMIAMTLGLSDVVLVKHYFAPDLAGLYAAVALCGRIVYFVLSFVPAVILPKASALATRGEPTAPLARRAFITFAGIAGTALLVFAIAPTTIIRILTGAGFLSAAPYVFAYGVAMMLLAGTQIATTYRIGLHRFEYVPALLIVMLAEPVVIIFAHASLWQVIDVLILGNACALAAALLWGRNSHVG